jgi:predicted porin
VNIDPEKVNYVVLQHAYYMRKSSSTYVSSTASDKEDSTQEIIHDGAADGNRGQTC